MSWRFGKFRRYVLLFANIILKREIYTMLVAEWDESLHFSLSLLDCLDFLDFLDFLDSGVAAVLEHDNIM